MDSKVIFKFLSIFLLLLILFSCGTSSNGIFEKRKHLKGWHFKKNKKFTLGEAGVKEKKKFKSNDKQQKEQEEPEISFQSLSSSDSFKTSMLKDKSALDTFTINYTDFQKAPNFKVSNPNYSSVLNRDKQSIIRPLNSQSISSIKGLDNNYVNQKIDNGDTSNLWGFNSAFFLFFLTPLLFKGNKSRVLQHWAANNKAKSQSLLVGLKVGLAGTSVGLGYLLEAPLSHPHLLMSASGIALSYGFWEYWKTQNTLNSTRKIALLSAVNTSTSFGFFTLGGMLSSALQLSSWSFSSGVLQTVAEVPENENLYSGIEIIVGVLILSIFTAAILVVIGFLSCTLICSGIEAAGIALLILGVYFTFVFYFYLLLKLFRKKDGEDIWSLKKSLLMTLAILGGVAFVVVGIGLLGGAYN